MIKKLLFWLLFPLILPQALWVRKTARRSVGAGGEPSGVVGEGPSVRLLAIGDSIIAGVGSKTFAKALVGQTAGCLAGELNAEVQWSAVGKNGITSNGVLNELLPQLPNETPDFIIVSVGVNDVTSLTGVQAWTENIDTLLSELHHAAPDAMIAFAGVPPLSRFPLLPQPLRALLGLRAEMLDEAAIEIIQRHDHTIHVPLSFDLERKHFCADGYHPNEDSYVEYGHMMANALMCKNNA